MYDGLKKLEVPTKGRHPGARRVVKFGLIGLLVLTVFVVSAGVATYLKVTSNINKGKRDIKGLIAPPPSGALNILVLGSDARSVVEAGQRNERQFRGGSGQRSDTIILLHIYPGAKHAVLVSFPRDLRVSIPGHGIDKINAAYSIGGAELMIKTVTQLTGLDINHYVEINFASFRNIVNAVGGVPLYFPKPVQDRKSGLNITQAGCINLTGDQALSFVRARYIYPNADLGRIQGQQRFIRALLNKTKSLGVLLNPLRLISLSDTAGKGLIFDKGISLGLARSIANSLKFDNKNVDFRQYPGTPRYVGGISYVVPEVSAARELFHALANNLPVPDVGKTGQSLPSPGDVTIKVVNGSGTSGLAARAQAALEAKGFHVPTISSTTQRFTSTVISYQAGDELKAELVAKQFSGAVLKLTTRPQPTDIVVVVGTVYANPSSAPTTAGSAKASVVGSCS